VQAEKRPLVHLASLLFDFTVKNIPEPIYNKLKQQAEAQHRSMNSEIIACLERSVAPKLVSPDEILRQARMMRKKVKGSLTAEEIRDAINQGRP
jgi:antitoxin FitA